jgi:hypothetical protein
MMSQNPDRNAPAPADSNTLDLGPNVFVFDPSMRSSDVQSRLDAAFAAREANPFGAEPIALLFKPGEYDLSVRLGFNTQVLGLGISPDDTLISGAVQADGAWASGNVTGNFWRGAENLAIAPAGGTAMWAVSQACPWRRMHVKGDLRLDDHGWASGGFLADSVVDGSIRFGTQQQWLTRCSRIGGSLGANWNIDFVGVENAPASSFPSPPYVTIEKAPVIREKPFLTIDREGRYGVFVPALGAECRGTSWESGPSPGRFVPIDRFHVARADRDTAESINAGLAEGKHLLLTPGIYRVAEPLRVTRPDTIVLGIGMATVRPEGGAIAMEVADVDGVTIAGLLFDAGEESSAILLRVGPDGGSADHARNPTLLTDVFFRVGGGGVGRAEVSLVINSSNVICDNMWVWRADHSRGVGWDVNTAENGLIVNGANVTAYGLFVEHYQGHQTIWNGEGGRVYFYQSEAPYDVPDQEGWMSGETLGFASYKVAETVKTHEAWGLGIYCNFHNRSVTLASAIEAPNTPGVRFHDMTTVSLAGGKGTIAHIVNTSGPSADPSNIKATLDEYP